MFQSGHPRFHLFQPSCGPRKFARCTVSSDGKYVATSNGTIVELWGRHTGQLLHTFHSVRTKELRYSHVLVFTPDGENIIALFGDAYSNYKQIKIWNCKSGELEQSIRTEKSNREIVVTPDSKHLLLNSGTQQLEVWEISTGRLLRSFAQQKRYYYQMKLSADGKTVITVSRNDYLIKATPTSRHYNSYQVVDLWDFESGKLLKKLPREKDLKKANWITHLALAPDGESLLICERNVDRQNILKFWDWKHEKKPVAFQKQKERIVSIAFRPNGTEAISAGDHGHVLLWDIKTGKVIRDLANMKDFYARMKITPDGKYITARLFANNYSIGDISALCQSTTRTEVDHSHHTSCIAFSRDGKLSISASDHIVIKDLASNKILHRIPIQIKKADLMKVEVEVGVYQILPTPDGKKFLTCTHGSIREWDIKTGRMLREFTVNKNQWYFCMAWVNDGNQFWTGGSEHNLSEWDYKTGQLIKSYTLDESEVIFDIDILPDEKKIFVGQGGFRACLFDKSKGKIVQRYDKRPDGIANIVLLPHETGFLFSDVSWNKDGPFYRQIFENSDGVSIKELFIGHEKMVHDIIISPGKKYLVSTSEDKTIKLWDSHKRTALATLHFDHPVLACCFSPDGQHILALDEKWHIHYLKFLNLPK